MTLASGTHLGPYEVIAPIGFGGMGEVYRARDTRLLRNVAVKILPAQFRSDVSREERFKREALAVSALNHPNICQLYDIGDQDGIHFLVLEYLEGETLADSIRAGPLALPDCLRIGVQIAGALEAAHSSGIIHRDLKPSNLFMTRRGEVKVLDFGLVKAIGTDEGVLDLTDQLSAPGTCMGTIAYMSPEQARGEPIDARSDLFSFGVVLYQMTTGQRPFSGSTPAVLFDAVLHRQAKSPSTLSSTIPIALERLIQRLMAKDPAARHRTAREVGEELRGIQLYGSQSMPAVQEIPSIAVLPFEDLSPDRSQQPFCEGMAAEIINALGTVEGLRVISRTSAVRCREKGMDLGEIGQHLGVRCVLEGTVRKSGARLRVNAQLVSTTDGSQTWSERYDRSEGDVFDIQDEIATAIVKNLKGRLVVSAPGVKRATVNLEAYEMYLKGRYYWERRNRASLQSAIKHFQQAIAADPEYALPHAGLSDCFTMLAVYSIKSYEESYPYASMLARRALALDPEAAEAHLSMGGVRLLIERDWTGAEESLTRALELDPKLAVARAYRAFVFATLRQWDKAEADATRTLADEPDSGLIHYLGAATRYWCGDLAAATTLIDRALVLEPKAVFIHWLRSWIFTFNGRADEAITESLKAAVAADHHQMLVSGLGVAYAGAGLVAEAEELIAELKARSAHECIGSQWIAEIYLALGRLPEALDYFERGYEERNSFLMQFAAGRQYLPLRGEPRYQALLQKMNLV